jgi:Subtilase family/NHL repeat
MRRKLPWRPRPSWMVCLAILVPALLGSVFPQAASAEGGFALSRVNPSYPACPEATPGRAECLGIHVPTVAAASAEAIGPALEGSGVEGGLSPSNLRSAYKIPETGGSGQIVAIVDAYNDPNAESDLKVYRKEYGLPECTKANGCLKKINQKGEEANYPSVPPPEEMGWVGEISLDLDMVSAACPDCHILLVEANNNYFENFDPAEDEAATLGATEISNSWGNKEFSGEKSYDTYYHHPGIPITFASGDDGYGVEYPAASRYVIAVGGTALRKEEKSARGWTEEVWRNTKYKVGEKGAGTESGCSSSEEAKPSWQHDTACAYRTDNDVAAVASCETPLSVYDSYEAKGWENWCGTSAASPFVAGIEALSTTHARSLGAEAFYLAGAKGLLFDVTKGSDGTCTPPAEDEYFCTAEAGYDGPTGEGAPDGALTVGNPSVTTELATAVVNTGATLNGTVNPEGLETKYHFEWGPTSSFGYVTPEVNAGSSMENQPVNQTITVLQPSKTFYYRIVATNGNGTTDGTLHTLTTPSVIEFGSSGTEEGKLEGPTDIGRDSNGDLWITEGCLCGNLLQTRVQEFNGHHEYIRTFDARKKSEAVDTAIAIDSHSHIWVAETIRVGEFNTSGERIGGFGTKGTEKGQFKEAAGIAVGPHGNIWVVDRGNDWVEEFNEKGEYLKTFGSKGSGSGQFNEPLQIAINGKGDIWITDSKNHRVEEFNEEGEFIASFGSEGSGDVQFKEPNGIAVNEKGDIWIADSQNNDVQEITEKGEYLKYFGVEGSGNGQFKFAEGIAAIEGYVWVADRENHRIEEWTVD